MDTLNLIEKILFVFTDNIWIFYLAVCLRQQVRMKAVSVREMTFLALLDKATSYVVLALMSVLGFFLAMRSGGGDRRLLLIAVDMLFVMGLMWLIKFRAILSYNFVLGKILEFAVVSADKNHIFYLLVDENERVIWEETTSDQRVIDYLEASPGDHFFVKVKQLKLGDPSPLLKGGGTMKSFRINPETLLVFKKSLKYIKESCMSLLVCRHPWRSAAVFLILLRNLKNDKYYF